MSLRVVKEVVKALLKVMEGVEPAAGAAFPGGNNLKGFKDFYLKEKARIWT